MKNFLTTCGAKTIELLALVAFALQRNKTDFFARWLGRLYARASVRQRRATEENLRLFLKEDDTRFLVQQIFENFCVTLYDFFFPAGLTIDVPDREKLEKLRVHGRGVMMLTFHMGHWELGARTMQEWGWPVTAVYQEYSNPAFRKMIQKRRAPGVNFLPVGARAAQGVLTALNRGDIVAMLGDHPFGESGIAVDLLGHKVRWPKGPVLLAVRENVPIVVALVIRVGHRHYRALIDDPLFPQNHSRAEVNRLVQEVAHKFGKVVAQNPEQWYRFRDFEFVK